MYNLLIAEDERKLRVIMKEYFLKRNFAVWEAADGMAAIRILEERNFDMVLLDVMMPELDGFQVCRAIRREKDTPVIFMTARVAEEDQLRGFQLKADDYITKPFSLPILHARVMAVLQRRQGAMCEVFCYDRAVDTTIKKLRHALGDRAGCIRTIVKVGYKFQEVEDE